MKRTVMRVALAAFCLLMGAGVVPAADVPLGLMPKDTEVVIGADVEQIMNADLVKSTYLSASQPAAKLEVLKNLTGIDLTTDVQNIFFYGRIDNKEAGGVIFRGKFDEKKVLALVQANPKYQTETIDGQAVHQWWEEKEKKIKYGVFRSGGMAVVYNSRASLDAGLAAEKDDAQSLASASDASSLIESTAAKSVWLVAMNRQHKGPAEQYGIQSLVGTLNLAGPQIDLALSITPQQAQDVPKWLDLLRGLVALGQLQPTDPGLRTIPDLPAIAAKATVSAGENQKSAHLTASMDQAQLEAIVKKKLGR